MTAIEILKTVRYLVWARQADGHEVDLHRQGDSPAEVAHEQHGALQHTTSRGGSSA